MILVANKFKTSITTAAIALIVVLLGHTVSAQLAPDPPVPLAPLSSVPIPQPRNINRFIKDKTAAIALGKALFWDMQLGTDGIQSCASCHFHAGADNRSKNQLNPGKLKDEKSSDDQEDKNFNIGGAPNYQLKPEDYPFHKLKDPNNRLSESTDTNDVTGSQGVFKAKFVDIDLNDNSGKDRVEPLGDDVFNVQHINVRQVTERNSPTAINAVFNFRNFWDGRAQDIFNGVNEWGLRDPDALVLRANGLNHLRDIRVRIDNSSLASQAVGPPLSAFETAAEDLRPAPLALAADLSQATGQVTVTNIQPSETVSTNEISQAEASANTEEPSPAQQNISEDPTIFRRVGRKLGKKLSPLRPLGKQVVAPDDSVLAPYRAKDKGLNTTYKAMVEQAFQPEWWNSNMIIKIKIDPTNDKQAIRTFIGKPNRELTTNEYTLLEYNFSLFFGLAVQAYESTLVSDNAPIDQYLKGNRGALTPAQVRGLEVFQNKGKCINCHGGAEFTNASVSNVRGERLERMIVGDGGQAIYDNGFYNIGVRPTQQDLGVGRDDKFGNPLSESRIAQQRLFRRLLGARPNINVRPNERITADGAFKAPGLRNVELTAPYFHNGGQLTLDHVVEFYNRGGDFREQNIENLDADIQNLHLSPQEKADLVSFLKALTDDRVRLDKAPFDHPQLFVPNGHPGNENSITSIGERGAADQLLEIPAVGRNGGRGTPNFLAQ